MLKLGILIEDFIVLRQWIRLKKIFAVVKTCWGKRYEWKGQRRNKEAVKWKYRREGRRYLGKNDGYRWKPDGTRKPGIDSPENPIVARNGYGLFITTDLTKGAEFICSWVIFNNKHHFFLCLKLLNIYRGK